LAKLLYQSYPIKKIIGRAAHLVERPKMGQAGHARCPLSGRGKVPAFPFHATGDFPIISGFYLPMPDLKLKRPA
jgi:hypothetical protein